MKRTLLSLLLAGALVSCQAAGLRGGSSSHVLDSETGQPVTLEEVADVLAASADVVFLGELHDSGPWAKTSQEHCQ